MKVKKTVTISPVPINPEIEIVLSSDGTNCRSVANCASVAKKVEGKIKKTTMQSVAKHTANTTRPFFRITGLITLEFKVFVGKQR